MQTLDVQQRSQQWYDARRGMATCSRFDSILTPKTAKPSSAQETLINELLAETMLPPEQGVIRGMTAEMEQGVILEAEARCCFELEFAKAPVKEVGFVIASNGLYGGSPDALVGEDSGCEIKCPAGHTHISYIREGVLPSEYKCQVHGYMIVTGRKQWDFFSYCRNLPPFHLTINRDEFTAKLESELATFVAKYNAERVKFGLTPIGANP
jgi:hypothetical protein